MAYSREQELIRVLKKHESNLLKLKGVHHVDIGYRYKNNERTDEMVIRLHVFNKLPKSILKDQMAPKRIEGYRVDVITSNRKKDFQYRVRPLTGGLAIRNLYEGSGGTLGAIFTSKIYGTVGLSNYHVLYGRRGGNNDAVVQPANSTDTVNDIIGTLVGGIEELDAAIFTLRNASDSDEGIIGVTESFIDAIDPERGDNVLKYGSTTEITYGTIEGISPDRRIITISHDRLRPNNGRIADSGDSGSIWIINEGERNFGIGLHYESEIDGTKAYAYNLSMIMIALELSHL